MVQWKTMALWFSLESECLLSAIFQWVVIIRKYCFFSRLASSLWEGVYRQYIGKKKVMRLSWCKSVPGVNQCTDLHLCRHLPSWPLTPQKYLLCCVKSLSVEVVSTCYTAVIANIFSCRWHWTEKQLQAIRAFVRGEARSEHKCWSAIQNFILQDNIVL